MAENEATRWTRRRFLLLSSTAGVTVAGGYGLFKWFFGEPTDIVLAILRRRVGYLRVKSESLLTFAKEYSTWKDRQELLSRLSVVALPMRFLSPYPWLKPAHSLRKLEDSIVSQFLLSTDFFLHDADESRDIEYLGFYDPYTASCRNPFYRPPTDGQAAHKQRSEAQAEEHQPDARGEADKLYDAKCSTCHGPSGAGDGPASRSLEPKPRDMSQASWQDGVTDDHIKKVILNGGPGVGKSPLMPASPELKQKPEVLDALVKKIRSFKKP